MSARERRRALAAVGESLMARDGGPGDQRGAALLRRLAGGRPGAIAFDDLERVPAWLRLPQAARAEVARRAALLSIAPALARTIDGALLGAHAEIAGEAALDWAIAREASVPGGGVAPVPPHALDAHGLALMRAALPERLRPLLGSDERAASPELAARCLAEAAESAA